MFEFCADPKSLEGARWMVCYLTTGKHLLFYHIVPPLLLSPMEGIFVEGVAEAYDGPFTVGRDGTLVMLPAGSDEIEVEQRL